MILCASTHDDSMSIMQPRIDYALVVVTLTVFWRSATHHELRNGTTHHDGDLSGDPTCVKIHLGGLFVGPFILRSVSVIRLRGLGVIHNHHPYTSQSRTICGDTKSRETWGRVWTVSRPISGKKFQAVGCRAWTPSNCHSTLILINETCEVCAAALASRSQSQASDTGS